jgi:hypothetical protein
VPPLAAIEVLGGISAVAAPVALEGLGRLLHLSAGVVRFRARRPSPPGVWRFRAAGSAGGRFPLEVYVAAHGVHGLEEASTGTTLLHTPSSGLDRRRSATTSRQP